MRKEKLGAFQPWTKEAQEYKMRSLTINGGRSLVGVVENPGGEKNVVNKLLIASCLGKGPSTIRNAPDIGEVKIAAEMLFSLGVAVEFAGGRRRIAVDPGEMRSALIPTELGALSRISMLTLGLLLSSFRKADIPLPGGDKLGNRPIDVHIKGMEALGAKKIAMSAERLHMNTDTGLHGADVFMELESFTGTENLVIAAAKAEGDTTIINACLFPEVHELITFLNNGGARINPVIDDKGQKFIKISGASKITGMDHELKTDINAVVTYAVAALITDSEKGILVKKTKAEDVIQLLKLLDEMGGGYEVQDDGILFYSKGQLKAPKRKIITSTEMDEKTSEYLCIRTDWQPFICLLLLKAEGTSEVIETIFSERFQHLEAAQKAGANIQYFDPKQEDPTITYYFKQDNRLHGARITGGKKLEPIVTSGSNDIRFGAFCVLLGLMSEGQSHMKDITQIKRGYDDLIENLQSLNANIRVI